MLKFNEILIVGDSFCHHRHGDWHWPQRLAARLTGETDIPRGAGFNGASWWSVRKELLKELNASPVKLLIICHTEPDRIPHDHDLALNAACVNEGRLVKYYMYLQNQFPIAEIQEAGQKYYKYLYSTEFHQWCQHQWFRDLNDIIHNIPFVVHLPCFTKSVYEHATGIRCSIPLFECNFVTDPTNLSGLSEANHMTIDENQKFAEALYVVITDYMINRDRDREFII